MPSSHRQALRMHFAEFPFGDFRTQQLLAQLIIMFHAANRGKKSKPLELKDVAPWLITASTRKSKRSKTEIQMRCALLDMIPNT